MNATFESIERPNLGVAPSELPFELPKRSQLLASVLPGQIEVGLPAAAEQVSRRLLETERSYRVAIAQITTDPGKIKSNTEKIVSYIETARQAGAQLVIFPELAIPGYASMDLLFNKDYVRKNILALETIKQASDGITVVVGFCDTQEGKTRSGGRPVLYNSAAIIRDGKILSIQDKSLLPNYDIFFEDRYFCPPRKREVVEAGGVKLGVEICEDLWKEGYDVDVTDELAKKGAEIIINLSASPFQFGKLPVRQALIKNETTKHHTPFIYTNLVGSFDGYEGEVVFDGRSIIMSSDGKTIGQGKAFKEDLLIVDVFGQQELEIAPMTDMEALYESLVLGIKDYFRRIGKSQAVLGLSGGVDSALVAALAADALGPENVLGISMPYKYSSSETRLDAKKQADAVNIRFKEVSIQKSTDAFLETLNEDPQFAQAKRDGDTTEENAQARERMKMLMAYANRFGMIVLNTGNRTELALNNMTLYGDMVGGFSVLAGVDKDRIYDLCNFMNHRQGREVILQSIIDRVPSAELKPGQSDAQVMGDHPQILAPMVRDVIEQGLAMESEAFPAFRDQFSIEQIRKVYHRLDDSEFKRRQACPGIRVTPHDFGNGRRIPISHGFEKDS